MNERSAREVAAGWRRTHRRVRGWQVAPCNPIPPDLSQRGRAGVRRRGADERVLPAGLASWRSSSVSASMIARASKARFLRPTFTCCTTPAASSRVMAWFVAWKLRSMTSAAPATVRTGAPGSRCSRRSTAEPERTQPTAFSPLLLNSLHLSLEVSSVVDGASARCTEEGASAVHAVVRGSRVRLPALTGCGKPGCGWPARR